MSFLTGVHPKGATAEMPHIDGYVDADDVDVKENYDIDDDDLNADDVDVKENDDIDNDYVNADDVDVCK